MTYLDKQHAVLLSQTSGLAKQSAAFCFFPLLDLPHTLIEVFALTFMEDIHPHVEERRRSS